MANVQTIHQLIGKVGNDPKLIDELLAKKDEKERKAVLVGRGITSASEKGPTRDEIAKEITKMLQPTAAKAGVGERAVEWVTAIATAAAGAIAAACTGDV